VGSRSPWPGLVSLKLKRCASKDSTTRASRRARYWPRQLRGPCAFEDVRTAEIRSPMPAGAVALAHVPQGGQGTDSGSCVRHVHACAPYNVPQGGQGTDPGSCVRHVHACARYKVPQGGQGTDSGSCVRHVHACAHYNVRVQRAWRRALCQKAGARAYSKWSVHTHARFWLPFC